ncbi:hypothetical protein B9P52_04480 [Achromobacter denitrificans]|nr:hypothetical protein B9P52_04480 [Achromobacter denitrificans]
MNFQFNDTFYGHGINVLPVPPQMPRLRRIAKWASRNFTSILGTSASILTIVSLIAPFVK